LTEATVVCHHHGRNHDPDRPLPEITGAALDEAAWVQAHGTRAGSVFARTPFAPATTHPIELEDIA